MVGQVYFILVQGFAGQTGSFTFVVEDDGVSCSGTGHVYTIPELYENLPSLVGTDVQVECYAIDGSQNNCDTCRFAILLSGGVDSTNNRSDYWDDLTDFYCYKRSHNWCEANTKVFYFKGNRPTAPFNSRGTAIPAAAVDSATQAKIQAQINAISSKIKACKAAGKTSRFEMVVSNHGQQRVNNANPGGINMLGNDLITPTELTAMMQTLVDSGLTKWMLSSASVLVDRW
ncbi:MAG: hypothetical protein IPP40_18135 [bacterium]|nr:hypothetical protein [bacterium]